MCHRKPCLSSVSTFLIVLLFSLCSFSVVLAESELARGLGFQSAPEIRTTKLPLAEVGGFYSTQLEAGDEWAAVRWSIVGELPEGLLLDPLTGVLSGTPASFGRYEFAVRLTDYAGATAEKSFEFYVLNIVKDPGSLLPIEPPAAPSVFRQTRSAAPALLAEQQAASQTMSGPDLSGLLDILEATAEGNWVQVNANFYQDVWAPPDLQPLKGLGPSAPRAIIAAWSSFAWDSTRGDLLLYGGGHANSSGNEVYRWRGSTRLWERASLPSEIKRLNPESLHYTAIDGAYAAPPSAHTYDNNIYLPIADRFLTFGGASFNTGWTFTRETATGTALTGPYVFNPALADPDRVGGTTGSHVQRNGPHPEIVGGEMWQNRDGYSYFTGTNFIPVSYIHGATGYVEENGKDVVYVSARTGGTAMGLFKYVLNDVDDPSADSWAKVGTFWNGGSDQGTGAYHPGLNIFVRTSGETFLYWDLSTAGVFNRDVVFTPTEPSGEFGVPKLRHYGLDYDPVGEQFMLWGGGGAVWALEPPPAVGATGWNLVKQPTPDSNVPDIDVGTGVLGKWKYVPNLDAFIALQGIYAGNIWLYKPIGWVRPGSDVVDTDADGIPDDFEIQYGFDPNDPNDAAGDFDSDGLSNLEEFQLGTDPTVPDVLDPVISLSSPAEGAQFASGSDISLTALLGGDANKTVSAVEFYADGILLGRDSSAPYEFTWSAAPVGTRVLSATAIDPVDGNVVSALVNILVVPPPAGGDLILQDGVDGYAGTQDSNLSVWNKDSNFGDSSQLRQQTGRYEDLIRFAVFDAENGPMPRGVQIQSAVISVYKGSYYDHTYGLHRLLKDWNESQVSWNRASTAEVWSQPGASGVGSDVAPTMDAQATIGWEPGWIDFDVTAAVQAMSDGDANYGWRLTGLAGNRNLKRIHSSEYADDTSLRPKLVISYLDAGPVDRPSVALTDPAPGAEFTVGSSVLLKAAVGDDANATVTGVDFYADGALIGQAADAPYEINWLATAQGSYALTAAAIDPVDGDVGSLPVVVDVVASVPPTVTLNSPADGAEFTVGTTVSIEAAVDGDPNASVTGLNFYANGQLIGQSASAPHQVTWPTTALGSYTLTAMAIDPMDGDATSMPIVVEVLAPVPPVILLTNPVEGAVFTAGSQISLETSISGDGNSSVERVEFYADGVLLGQDAAAPYTFTWNGAAVGGHVLTARAVDPVDGNGTSIAVNMVVNPVPAPTVALTSPDDGTRLTAGVDVTLQAVVGSDANATVTAVEFYADGVLIGQDTSAPYQAIWSNVAVGGHVLSALAIDPADGSAVSAPVNLTVDPALPPSVALVQPVDGQVFNAGTTVLLQAAVSSDPNGTVSGVAFYADGALIGQDTTAPYEFSWSNVAQGSYQLTAIVFDSVDGDGQSTLVGIDVLGGGQISLQEGAAGYSGTSDSYLSIWHKDLNFGASSRLSHQSGRFEYLIQFDVLDDVGGPLPAGAQIQSAELSLYKYSYYDHSFGLRRVLRDWDEGQVSWNSAKSGQAWGLPGATALGTDVAQVLEAQTTAGWAPEWVNFDVTAAVQAIADGQANYGWKVEGLGGNRNLKRFHSSESNVDPALRPKLTVTYTLGPASP